MPWVRRHRRHAPNSWFRTTTVQTHHRRSPLTAALIPVAIAVAVIILLIALF